MMDVSSRAGIRSRRPKKAVNGEHFARLVLSLPQMSRKTAQGPAGSLIAFLLLGGFGLGAWWPRDVSRPTVQEDVFVFEEAVLQTLPAPEISTLSSQSSAPPPPEKPKASNEKARKKKSPPKPQFGLEEAGLSEAGNLAVARGNTLAMEEEVVVHPPPAPVFLDRQPGIILGTPPEYPARALERGLEGSVVALVTIDTQGRVTDARIEQSAGRDFDGPVLDAVLRLSFQPLIREGRKWPAHFRIPYEFKLE